MQNTKRKQIEISIIMPVHNAGIYLEETLESVFAQTFREFELICVDDCSDDGLTRDLLHAFGRRHDNMRLIELEHPVGAAEARNTGFSKAQGTYVIFLDADDIFADDLLEKMYSCICINSADVCVCGYQDFYVEDGKKYYGSKCIPSEYKLNSTNRDTWLMEIPTSPWNKLCSARFLRENRIYFQSLSSCNDVFFSCRVILNAAKRCCVEEVPLVFYRGRSQTQISSRRNPVDLYQAIALLNAVEEKNFDKNSLLRWTGALLLRNGIIELEKSKNESFNQQFYELLRNFLEEHPIEFQNKILIADQENVEKLPYESKWMRRPMDFLGQLRVTGKLWEREIGGTGGLFLWGLGLRGNAFQQFCRERGIDLQGVADKKNDQIGGMTEYGNQIVHTEEVLKSGGKIIASNNKIYEYLLSKNLESVNLEEYCPF